jgi:hypothetical protein
MNITHIKPVERDLIRITASRFWVADLAILFSFGELGNDRDS